MSYPHQPQQYGQPPYQQPYRQPGPAQPQGPAKPTKPKKPTPVLGGILLLGLIVALCVIGGSLIMSGTEDAPTDPVSADRSTDAEVMCEEFIGRRLKSPGSAEYAHRQTTKNGAQYVVVGYVDSQNSFGALVRTDYVCTVTDQGDDKWRLDDLRLDE